MSKTYLDRAYEVIEDLGLVGLAPEHRNELAVAFADYLEMSEAAIRQRAATYMRSMANLLDPPDEDE